MWRVALQGHRVEGEFIQWREVVADGGGEKSSDAG